MARLTIVYEPPSNHPTLHMVHEGSLRIASIDIGEVGVDKINIYAVAQNLAELLLEQLEYGTASESK